MSGRGSPFTCSRACSYSEEASPERTTRLLGAAAR